MDTTEHHEIKLTIRLPVNIAEKMRRLAKAHDRSLNGEIVRALRTYGAQREQREPAEQER
ncbi:MAG: Arc family DNA-binding protein [Ktedonobacterales bacterium]